MLNRFLNLSGKPEDDAYSQARNALRISLVILFVTAISAGIYLVLAIQSGAWQLYAWSASTGAFALAVIVGVLLIRRGRVTTGIELLLIALHVTFIFSITLIDGIGIPIGITIALMTAIIAGQTLQAKQSNWAVALGAIGGISAMLLEVYLPFGRYIQTQFIRNYLLTIMAIVFLFFGYLIIQQFRYYLLRTKLIIAFIGIVFTSIGLIASVSSIVLRANLTADIGDQFYTLARSKATEIGQVLKRETNTLSALTYNKLVQQSILDANEKGFLSQDEIDRLDQQWQSGNNEQLVNSVINNELGNEFRRFQKEFPQYSEIFLTDQQGVIIATANRTTDYNQADEDWWTRAFREGKFIGQPEYDESSGTISVIVASRVRTSDTGETIGVLRATVALTSFTDSLSSGLFGKTGHVDIYLPRGQEIQIQPDENGKYVVTLTDAETDIVPFISLAGKYLEISINNVPTLASGYPVRANDDATNDDDLAISNLSWRVLVLQDQSEAFQAIEAQTRNNILLTIVISILVALAALGMSQLIAAPLSRLTAVASQISSGNLSVQASVETGDEIGTLATTFNTMTSQLRESINTLEQRVNERTKELEGRSSQLEAIADVARSVANIQEFERLLNTITRLVSERFNFYHVGIFLLDQNKEFAILSAANSEGGRNMLKRDHRLKVASQGIVGYVTYSGESRIALDVGEDAAYFNNPDLPETHSEVALPLKIGSEIIGALDIQSKETNAFTRADLEIFTILADQVAVAIQNTRSLEQAQRALHEAELATRQLTRSAWKNYTGNVQSKGYRYDGIRPEPLKKETKSATDKDAMTIPVQLHGQTIGRLKLKSTDASRKLSDDELAIIESTADRVALAIDAARLLDEAQKRASRESFLSEIGSKLSTSFQLDTILRDTVEELGQTLKGSTITFQLINPHTPPSVETQDEGLTRRKKSE